MYKITYQIEGVTGFSIIGETTDITIALSKFTDTVVRGAKEVAETPGSTIIVTLIGELNKEVDVIRKVVMTS